MPDWDAGHFALWRPAKRLLLEAVIGDFHVHVIFEKRKIYTWARRRGGEAVDLTATEYELLRVLSLDAGCVATFETLRRPVWAKRDSADAKLVRIFARKSGTCGASSATARPAPPGWRCCGPRYRA